MNKNLENNQVTICGEIISEFSYSHQLYGEKFYAVNVKVPRYSDNSDTLPVIVSERLVDTREDLIGLFVRVEGQFRSYNRHDEVKSHLVLSVFAREIEFVDDLTLGELGNSIYLDGYICKEPIYRKTPLGREIADLMLAVNRPYGKSDYIPCICWGRNARYASEFKVGERCAVQGRIQSREYIKKLEDGNAETRIAYEVSVSKLEVPEDEE